MRLPEGGRQTGPVAACSAMQMQRLKWAIVWVSGQSQDWYGCVFIASILRPAFNQPEPPVESTYSTIISCVDAHVSVLHCSPERLPSGMLYHHFMSNPATESRRYSSD